MYFAFVSLLALGACGSSPTEVVIEERVDTVEVNHFYDANGKHIFDQVIFYEWSMRDGRHQVRAWRLVKHTGQIPVRDWKHGGYVTTWHDAGVLRSIRAAALRETWTQYDPELVEREVLPMDRRRELILLDRRSTD